MRATVRIEVEVDETECEDISPLDKTLAQMMLRELAERSVESGMYANGKGFFGPSDEDAGCAFYPATIVSVTDCE